MRTGEGEMDVDRTCDGESERLGFKLANLCECTYVNGKPFSGIEMQVSLGEIVQTCTVTDEINDREQAS